MKRKSIGIDALLLAIYFALAPMHQTLVLPNGSTVVKYLAFGVMIACVLHGYIERREFLLIWDLIWPVALMLGWFALSIIWADSRSTTLSSLVSVGSYCALLLIVGSRKWNDREKALLLMAIVVSCVFYSIRLIVTAAANRRATLIFAMREGEFEADQNTVANNIGIGALAAFAFFLHKRGGLRWLALGCVPVILAGMINTGSRGGVISFLAGAAYLYFAEAARDPRLRSSFFILPCGILIVLWALLDSKIIGNNVIRERFLHLGERGLNGRLEIWQQYLETLLHRPVGFLGGYGLGCDSSAHAAYMGRVWLRSAHNDYLSLLCQVGVPGLLLTGSFVRHIWARSRGMSNLFGCACIVLALVASMEINFMKTYGWWNAMILAYIGAEGSLAETNREVMFSLPPRRQEKQSLGRSAP